MNTEDREYIADVVGDIVILDPENSIGACAWSLRISDFLSEMPQKSTLRFVQTALAIGEESVEEFKSSKDSNLVLSGLGNRVAIGQQKFATEFPDGIDG